MFTYFQTPETGGERVSFRGLSGAAMKRLGELLVKGGWLGEEQLAEALRHHHLVRGRLGTSLLELQLVSEDILLGVLSEQHKVPQANATALRSVPESSSGRFQVDSQ